MRNHRGVSLVALAALCALLAWGVTACGPAPEAEDTDDESQGEENGGDVVDDGGSETEGTESNGEGDGGIVTTDSGLKYQDLTTGSGDEAVVGSTVYVYYTGWLEDGTQFDSNQEQGRAPFDVTLGEGRVIAGWEEGLLGMKVGGKRKLIIPSHLAYKEHGYPGAIPPNAMLIFEVVVVEIR